MRAVRWLIAVCAVLAIFAFGSFASAQGRSRDQNRDRDRGTTARQTPAPTPTPTPEPRVQGRDNNGRDNNSRDRGRDNVERRGDDRRDRGRDVRRDDRRRDNRRDDRSTVQRRRVRRFIRQDGRYAGTRYHHEWYGRFGANDHAVFPVHYDGPEWFFGVLDGSQRIGPHFKTLAIIPVFRYFYWPFPYPPEPGTHTYTLPRKREPVRCDDGRMCYDYWDWHNATIVINEDPNDDSAYEFDDEDVPR
jgi:hypothetical protein